MAAKFVVVLALVAAGQCSVVPVAKVDTDYSSFAYDVADPNTGDYKSQVETRANGAVAGQYSLLDADGTKRTVDYTADDVNGFNAVVRKDPIVAAAPVVAAPAVYSAPVVTKTVVSSPVVSSHVVASPVVAKTVLSSPVISSHVVASPLVAKGVLSSPVYSAPTVYAASSPVLSHSYPSVYSPSLYSAGVYSPSLYSSGVYAPNVYGRVAYGSPLSYSAPLSYW